MQIYTEGFIINDATNSFVLLTRIKIQKDFGIKQVKLAIDESK